MRTRSSNSGIQHIRRIGQTDPSADPIGDFAFSFEEGQLSNYTLNEITDDPLLPTGGYREKPCNHQRYSYLMGSLPPWHTGYTRYPLAPGGFPKRNEMWKTNAIEHNMVRLLTGSGGVSTYELDWSHDYSPSLEDVPLSLQQSSFESMLPKVNDGLSLINFILELKDLRRMFQSKTIMELVNKLNFNPMTRRRAEGITMKDLSNDFLNSQFGWKPFISDIIGAWKALKHLDHKIKYLEANANRVLRRHSSVDLLEDYPAPDNTILTAPVSAIYGTQLYDLTGTENPIGNVRIGECHIERLYDYIPRYHQTIAYRYTLPNVGSLRRTVRAYLDAFGVRLDPSIIWNAIPFSFVVDWFVDFGKFLRTFSPTDLGMEVVILDASHSVKWHAVTTITARIPSADGLHTQTTHLGVLERSHYERSIQVDPELFRSDISNPTALQWSLGGALVLSNKKDKRLRARGRRLNIWGF